MENIIKANSKFSSIGKKIIVLKTKNGTWTQSLYIEGSFNLTLEISIKSIAVFKIFGFAKAFIFDFTPWIK